MPNLHATDGLRAHLTVGDRVVVKDNNKIDLGKIIKAHGDGRISVSLFSCVTSTLLLQHSLAPVTETESPLEVKSGMAEVILTQNTIKISRLSIVDIAFIVALAELDSGFFHLTGAVNTFFACYQYKPNGTISPYLHFMLQARVAPPVSYQIFIGLNMLSSLVKKTLFHQPEDQSTTKTFRMSLCYNTFFFLWSKFLNNINAILNKLDWTQRVVQYFDDLSMKSSCWYNQVFVIPILTTAALTLLRKC